MASSYLQIYLHCVWSTFLRQPVLTQEIMRAVARSVAAKVKQLECELLAFGGHRDHVHVLVRLRPTLSVSSFISEIKGASSHLVNQSFQLEPRFRWQSGYGILSISKRSIPDVVAYVLDQENRHSTGSLIDDLERSEDSGSDERD